MCKLGSHDSFGHLKHKLWSKERLRVKLTIWLLTIKSQKSTQFPYVQATCDIPLKRFGPGLQFCFRPHCNQRSAREVMGPPKLWQSQLWEFWDSHLGVPRKNAIWMWPSWRDTESTIKGKVLASLKSRPWWVLWVWGRPWLVLAPKVLKLCTNQCVVWFV
jgi:hypothetical protein